MESPTSSETVGRLAVYLADMMDIVVCVVFRGRGGKLEDMSQALVMAGLGGAVWLWWCSSLHTP